MTIAAKIKWLILPSLLMLGLGTLEIKFPHAMQGFDDGYTGKGVAGLILLLVELFLTLTWGRIEGVILILLALSLIVWGFLPRVQQPESQGSTPSAVGDDQNRSKIPRSALALQRVKAAFGRDRNNHKP